MTLETDGPESRTLTSRADRSAFLQATLLALVVVTVVFVRLRLLQTPFEQQPLGQVAWLHCAAWQD